MTAIAAFLPLTVLIATAIITRNIMGSMTGAVALAMVLLYRENILGGTIQAFYKALADTSFQFCLVMIVLFGG